MLYLYCDEEKTTNNQTKQKPKTGQPGSMPALSYLRKVLPHHTGWLCLIMWGCVMNRESKLVSTDGIVYKSKSSFGNYKVEAKRLWTDYYGKQSIVRDVQLFFRVKEAKKFISTLPIYV